MSLQLTTAMTTGDLDTSDYAEVKIENIGINVDPPYIRLVCSYGNTVDSVWVPSLIAEKVMFKIIDHPQVGEEGESGYIAADPAYTDLVTNSDPLEGESTYAAVKRGLYQWLLDEDHFDGTII